MEKFQLDYFSNPAPSSHEIQENRCILPSQSEQPSLTSCSQPEYWNDINSASRYLIKVRFTFA